MASTGASRARAVVRAAGTLALGGLCIAYILWKIDLGETAHVHANARIPGALLLLTGALPGRRKDMGAEIRT
jgi:hypothetical protein